MNMQRPMFHAVHLLQRPPTDVEVRFGQQDTAPRTGKKNRKIATIAEQLFLMRHFSVTVRELTIVVDEPS